MDDVDLLTCGRALGEAFDGGFLSEDGLVFVFLLGSGGFGFDQALLLKYLLLLPPQILLFDELPPRLLLLFTQTVLLGFPSGLEQRRDVFCFKDFRCYRSRNVEEKKMTWLRLV